MLAGARFDLRPAGMLALDVARIEAGLLLIEVDFFSSRKALIAAQQYSPYEMGLGRLVQLDKATFVGQSALRAEHARGPVRQIVGLSVNWEEVEVLYETLQLPPQVPAAASRAAVPVYRNGAQVGKATSTTWSPVLKEMIALATVERAAAQVGSTLEMEVTVEAVRHRVGATVTATPFFNPPRKTARLA
jgi:aminomethyltransferase